MANSDGSTPAVEPVGEAAADAQVPAPVEQPAGSQAAPAGEASAPAQDTAAEAAPPAIAAEAAVELKLGDLVEYCLPTGRYANDYRPAIVIRSWADGHYQLCVFTDSGNDELPFPLWATSVTVGDGPGHCRPRA